MDYKCVIVDDEPLARKVIEDFISDVEDFHLTASFASPLDALKYLKQEKVHVLFLDINMPKLNGFQFLRQLSDPPLVVFTTAYAEFAVDAFEVSAFDYLVKPIPFDRFLRVVSKIKEHFSSVKSIDGSGKSFISIKEGKRLYKTNLHDIFFIKAYGDYVRIFTVNKTYITKEKLSKIAEKLPKSLLQCHRSYIVNTEHVEYIEGNHLVVNDVKVPISEKYRGDIINSLNPS